MKRTILAGIAGLLLAGQAAAAQDYGQLAAGTGLSRAEAARLSLGEIAALKLNRGADSDERQPVGLARATVIVDPARHAQLIAAAGLTPGEAQGMTLSELAAAKASHNARFDERQAGTVTPGSGGDTSQLAASAGLTPAEAAGMTLTEIAVAKFNRGAGSEQRQGY